MDSFWQQHRSFILKVAAGVFVFLVCLIIRGSLNEKGTAERAEENAKGRKSLLSQRAPAGADLRAHSRVVDSLSDRTLSIAHSIGFTSGSDESEARTRLRREVVGRILRGVNPELVRDRASFERQVDLHLEKARSNPIGCLVGLKAEARRLLLSRAARENIRIDEGLGFGRDTLRAEELDRYLISLALIVHVVNLAIDEDVFEVAKISIQTASEIESEGGGDDEEYYGSDDGGSSTLGMRYPVSFSVVAPSGTILSLLERIVRPVAEIGEGWGTPLAVDSIPPGMITLRDLNHIRRSSRARREDEDLMEASFVVMSLRMNVNAEAGE